MFKELDEFHELMHHSNVLPRLEVPLLLIVIDPKQQPSVVHLWHSTLVNIVSLIFSVMAVAY